MMCLKQAVQWNVNIYSYYLVVLHRIDAISHTNIESTEESTARFQMKIWFIYLSQSQKRVTIRKGFKFMIVKVKKWLFFLQNLFSVINFGSFFYNYIQLQKGLSASCSLFRNKKFDVLYKGSSLGYEQIQNWVRTTILIVKVFIFTWISSYLMKKSI